MQLNFQKRLSPLHLYLCILLLSISCKKESDPEPLSVVGTWAGKYSTSIATAPNIVWDPIIFKTGGSLAGSDRTGTYNVTGTVLTATYVRNGATFSFYCDIKENFTKLEGTWGTGASQSNGGLLLLTKQ
ncbi:MAG: hypothetical protein V4714_14500 [Bacteroidota bacterium]